LSETGSIKFRAERSKSPLDSFDGLGDLNIYRAKLRQLGFLGVDQNGIGFGNISLRDGATSQFHVTGSNTGDKTELTSKDCAKVTQYNVSNNWLQFQGETMPSSESLTHAAIYEARPAVGAIIHGHHSKLWAFLLRHAPGTPVEAEYGTPRMAEAVQELLGSAEPTSAFAMAGHEGGVIVFGRDLANAYDSLVRVLKSSGL
jgi:hypothetical protein